MPKTISQLTELATTPDATDEVVINDGGVTKRVNLTNLTAATFATGTKTAANGFNLALGTATGTQIATAASQRLGFYGATPVIQQPQTADLLDSLQAVGLIASGAGDTPLNLSGGVVNCGGVTSTNGGVGYATGAGGAVTQATSRATAVTIDKTCGSITMFSAAGSTTAASFTVNNSTVGVNDCIILNQRSGTNKYLLDVTAVAAGSFEITYRTTVGTSSDAPVINFAVIKAATS